MKSFLILVLFPFVSMAADLSKTEEIKINLSEGYQVELCQDLSDEHFCGSKIEKEKCIEANVFSGKAEVIKGEPKLFLSKKVTLKSKDSDLKFKKEDVYSVEIKKNKITSRYNYSSYSAKGLEKAPSFILDASCRGDGDSDD